MKFRRKPEEIEAIIFTGRNFTEVIDFGGEPILGFKKTKAGDYYVEVNSDGVLFSASKGDYIVKHEDGTVEVFNMMYMLGNYDEVVQVPDKALIPECPF